MSLQAFTTSSYCRLVWFASGFIRFGSDAAQNYIFPTLPDPGDEGWKGGLIHTKSDGHHQRHA